MAFEERLTGRQDDRLKSEVVTVKPSLDEGTRKWQLSPLDTIEEISQRLRGYNYNINQEKWVKVSEAWMNEEGIGKVSIILNTYINKNMQLSYFEPEIIENIAIEFGKSLSFLLQFYYREYGMEKEHVDIIATMICDTVYAGLMRARFGKESQFIENTEQRRIIQTEGGEDKKQGLTSRIPFLGGRL